METKKTTQKIIRTADGRFAVVQIAPNGTEQMVMGPWRDRRDAIAWLYPKKSNPASV